MYAAGPPTTTVGGAYGLEVPPLRFTSFSSRTGKIFRGYKPLVFALLGSLTIVLISFIPSRIIAPWLRDLISLPTAAFSALVGAEYYLEVAEALDLIRHPQATTHLTRLYQLSIGLHWMSTLLGVSAVPLIVAAIISNHFLCENTALFTAALCVAALGVTVATDAMELLVCRHSAAAGDIENNGAAEALARKYRQWSAKEFLTQQFTTASYLQRTPESASGTMTLPATTTASAMMR